MSWSIHSNYDTIVMSSGGFNVLVVNDRPRTVADPASDCENRPKNADSGRGSQTSLLVPNLLPYRYVGAAMERDAVDTLEALEDIHHGLVSRESPPATNADCRQVRE
jgi:hypothetical protein